MKRPKREGEGEVAVQLLNKTSENKPKRDAKGRLLPGQPSINPKGRPQGTSIKDRVRKYLEENPIDMEDFVQHFVRKNRELAWQMLEGRPAQDLTSGGEKINPVPIYGGKSLDSIQGHDGDQESISTEKEDSSG